MSIKIRLMQVTERHEIEALKRHADDIGTPRCQIVGDTIWADADELRAWRGLQNTSGAKHEG